MKITGLILLGLLVFLAGCGGTTPESWTPSGKITLSPRESGSVTAKITECDAVRIARAELPAEFAQTQAIPFFAKDEQAHEMWALLFAVVKIPFTELGWTGKADDYYIKNELEQEMPQGVYANVMIYVDAETGSVVKRELSNSYILGGPGMYSDCK
jgi:hypothetical protein